MLRECLRNTSHVSPELIARLDMYSAKLAPSQTASDSGYDSASTSRDRDSVISQKGISNSISDMPMVLNVGHLFKIPQQVMQKEVDELSKTCTEKVSPVVQIRELHISHMPMI